jgi:MFS family permease
MTTAPGGALAPRRATLLLIGAVTGTGTLFYAALPPLLPDYVSAFALTPAGIGVLSAAFGAGTLLGSPAAGLVAARSLRLAVLAGLALTLAGSASLAVATGAWAVTAARCVLGAAHAFAYTGALAWLYHVAPARRQTQLLGTVTSVAVAGALLGPLLGVAASRLGGAPAFGAATVAVGLLALAVRRRAPAARVQRAVPAGFLRAALRGPLALALALIALHAGLQGVLAVLGPLRLDAVGWSAGGIAAMFVAASAVGIATYPALGRLCDRRGLRPVLLGALAGSALVTVALAAPARHWTLAAVVVVCAVTYNAIAVPAVGLLTARGQAAGYPRGMVTALVPLTWAALNVVGAFAGAGLSAVGAALPACAGVLLCAVAAVRVAGSREFSESPGATAFERV